MSNDSSETKVEAAPAQPTPSTELPTTKTPMPSDVVTQPVAPKQGRFIAMIMVAVVAVLVLGSLITFAVLTNSPEAKLAKAFTNLRDADSVTTVLDLEVTDQSDSTINVGGEVSIVVNPLQLASEGEIDLFIARLKADALYIDDNYYVKVSGIEELQGLLGLALLGSADIDASSGSIEGLDELETILNTLVAEVDDQWIEIQGSAAKEIGLDVEDVFTKVQQNYASIDNIADAFTIVEVFEDGTVAGSDAMHMRLALDPAVAPEVLTQLVSGVTIADQTITQEEARTEFEDLFDDYNPAEDTVDAWIDNATGNLVQLRLSMTDSSGDQVLTINMKDYNAVESFTAPENPKTLLELTTLFTELAEPLSSTQLDPNQLLELPL